MGLDGMVSVECYHSSIVSRCFCGIMVANRDHPNCRNLTKGVLAMQKDHAINNHQYCAKSSAGSLPH